MAQRTKAVWSEALKTRKRRVKSEGAWMFFVLERARPAASARSVLQYASTGATGIEKLSGEKHQAAYASTGATGSEKLSGEKHQAPYASTGAAGIEKLPGEKHQAPVLALVLVGTCACTSIDPGRNFSLPNVTFDADYFYCHVEPELIVAKHCGPGDPSQGDPSNACHFTASAVTAMDLFDHPAVDCAGGDHPATLTQIGSGSAAQLNYESVSREMSKDPQSAPVYVRPSGAYHPRHVFAPGDPVVLQLLSTWASK
jgi:hypothetical protein